MNLTDKKCIPCEGGASPLKPEEAISYFKEISGWKEDEDFKKISKKFQFKNFKEALSFVNKVGELAEEENHHPDIKIHSYKKVLVELSTHAIGGLSENDFIMAAKIDELLK